MLRNVFPQSLLRNLTQLFQLIDVKTFLCNDKINSKGVKATFPLGHYLDRAGNIIHSKFNSTPLGNKIFEALQPLANILASVIIQMDPDYANILQEIPSSYRTFGKLLSVFYGNIFPPENTHKDRRDYKWCYIFPFGTVQQTGVHLEYLNTYAHLNIGDVLKLKSCHVWHRADCIYDTNLQSRFSGVFTSHTGFINRCVKNKIKK